MAATPGKRWSASSSGGRVVRLLLALLAGCLGAPAQKEQAADPPRPIALFLYNANDPTGFELWAKNLAQTVDATRYRVVLEGEVTDVATFDAALRRHREIGMLCYAGHAGYGILYLNLWSTDATSNIAAADDSFLRIDGKLKRCTNVQTLYTGNLAPGARIYLAGCHTADDFSDDLGPEGSTRYVPSIAQSVATHFQRTTVGGFQGVDLPSPRQKAAWYRQQGKAFCAECFCPPMGKLTMTRDELRPYWELRLPWSVEGWAVFQPDVRSGPAMEKQQPEARAVPLLPLVSGIMLVLAVVGLAYYFVIARPHEQERARVAAQYLPQPHQAVALEHATAEQQRYLPSVLAGATRIDIRRRLAPEQATVVITDPAEIAAFVNATRVTYVQEARAGWGEIDLIFTKPSGASITINFNRDNTEDRCLIYDNPWQIQAFPSVAFQQLVAKHLGT